MPTVVTVIGNLAAQLVGVKAVFKDAEHIRSLGNSIDLTCEGRSIEPLLRASGCAVEMAGGSVDEL